MLKMTVNVERWPLHKPFVISRMEPMLHGEVVMVEIEQGGIVGRGECERTDVFEPEYPSVTNELAKVKNLIEQGVSRAQLLTIMPAGNARNAIDCALFELEAKQQGLSSWQLAEMATPKPLTTAFTLSLASPLKMAEEAATNNWRPMLKLKLGSDGDLLRVAAVHHAAPNCRLIIDANTSWSLEQLKEYLPQLAKLGVEMIEQPLPVGQDHLLEGLNPQIPITADESCLDRSSLPQLRGRYQAINIKLDKTGGITEALSLLRAAQDEGFEIMVGCMLGTSLAMAPALLIAQAARWVDLDGPLLLSADRPAALEYKGSTVLPASAELWI
ncbi:MAG: N-acetyl-D-Glu racemase DgcA [Oceanospirillaceae bacterium]